MANRYAIATGNWSNPAIWDGGVAVPTTGDTVRPNTFTVTINQDITVAELRNDAAAPAAAGGQFVVSSIPGGGRSIAANLPAVLTTTLLAVTAASGTLTITGTITGTSSAAGAFDTVSISGTAPTVNIIGDVIAPPAAASSNSTVTVRLTGGTAAVVNITGNVTGTSGGGTGTHNALQVNATATATVTGNVTGGTGVGGAASPTINTSGRLTVNGTVTGGTQAASGTYAILGGTGAVVDINGPVYATTNVEGVLSTAANIFRFRGELVDAANGRPATRVVFAIYPALPVKTAITMRVDGGWPSIGGTTTLANFEDNGLPDPADVRVGVVYGPNDELTGTRHASVTTGDVWSYLLADADVAGSIGAYLRHAATVASTGAQLAAALDDLE